MGDFYKESNLESTIDLYNKSIIYTGDMVEYGETYSNIVDFNFGEKYFYGRVDRDFVSIQLNEKLVSFKQVRSSPDISNVKHKSLSGNTNLI